MTPALSIIVPIYNVEPYLRQCVDSILAQSYTDFELLLVDDGSPDGCGAICDGYAQKDSRVQVIHKENGGLVSAWKAGVSAACGQYVGFVDGDDWVDPTFYANLCQAITQTEADVVVGERSEDEEGLPPLMSRRAETVEYAGAEGIRRLMEAFFLAFLHDDRSTLPITYSRCDKLYRREVLLDNWDWYNDRVAMDEDRIANAAILSGCGKVLVLSGTGKYHYRTRRGSMSSAYSERDMDMFSELSVSLMAIADAKGLDKDPVETYIGGAAYRCIYHTAQQPGLSGQDKLRRIRSALACIPPRALAKYAAARGSLFVRLFCRALDMGLLAPCVWTVMLHSALQKGETRP